MMDDRGTARWEWKKYRVVPRVHPSRTLLYHYTQKDYRTELYYFRIIFGNSRSVITEPICFWN